MKIVLSLSLIIGCVLLNGCMHSRAARDIPPIDKHEAEILKALVETGRLHFKAGSLTKAERDEVTERLLGYADARYVAVRNALLSSRSAMDFFSEAASTSLSSVTGPSGFTSRAIVLACGKSSRSNPNRFDPS